MIDIFQVNPGLWLILAGLICALVPKGDTFAMVRKALVIGAPILAAVMITQIYTCLLYTSPSPRDATLSRMPSSA